MEMEGRKRRQSDLRENGNGKKKGDGVGKAKSQLNVNQEWRGEINGN